MDSIVVICNYTGATLSTGSPPMHILLLELGEGRKGRREGGKRESDFLILHLVVD